MSSNAGGGGPNAWDLFIAIAPAIVPTVMAAALEIWRVRRADAAEKLARLERRRRKRVYDDDEITEEGEGNDGAI
jgi:myosin-crossreactive antigen